MIKTKINIGNRLKDQEEGNKKNYSNLQARALHKPLSPEEEYINSGNNQNLARDFPFLTWI